MKHVLTCTFCVLLAACGATTGPTVVASQADSPKRNSIATLPANPVQDASFGLILNDLRQKSGADPVTFDIRLNAAAQAHAEDMLARGYFNHRNQAGQSEYDRIVAAGYNPKNWGENIAQGQQSEAAALIGWINSPEHNRLLRARTVDHFGLGVAGSGVNRRWVLLMGRER